MARQNEQNQVYVPILLGAVLAFVVSGTLFSPFFRLRDIEVNLNPFSTKEELIEAGQLKLDETLVPFVNESKLIKNLKTHPYVKNAKIRKKLPNQLVFDIEYRQDAFAIPNAGYFIILDDQLQVLRVDQMSYDATVLEGITFKEFNIGEKIVVDQPRQLQQIVSLKELMGKSHIVFLPKIRMVDNAIYVDTKNGIQAAFGDGNHVEDRFNHFAEIFDNLQAKGIQSGLIDVSNDGLPTYKPFGN